MSEKMSSNFLKISGQNIKIRIFYVGEHRKSDRKLMLTLVEKNIDMGEG